ncbi:MAG: hypothetical protein U5R49_21960 [Deltaproteobacteria bacterium]|nr:hypothetical protein [Deltaproteobacteria bacterium]
MTKLKLDGRRSHSKNIKQLKQQLTETPISTAKQILVGQIARNTVVEEQMFKKAMEQNLFDENGEPEHHY